MIIPGVFPPPTPIPKPLHAASMWGSQAALANAPNLNAYEQKMRTFPLYEAQKKWMEDARKREVAKEWDEEFKKPKTSKKQNADSHSEQVLRPVIEEQDEELQKEKEGVLKYRL